MNGHAVFEISKVEQTMNEARHFESIVNEHYEGLYRFAMSLTRSESDARDLTQHTFYVWATKGHQLRDLSKTKTWLFTTLHRAFLNTRRREAIHPRQDLDEVINELTAVSPELSDRLDSMQVLPALAKVDAGFQAAVALFYIEDYAYRDIAQILGVPIGTVKSRIARGIAQLREILLSGDETASRVHTNRVLSPSAATEPIQQLVNHKTVTAAFGVGSN
jgi:RNA polymerase sigma-70 factor (ECF subfamily)